MDEYESLKQRLQSEGAYFHPAMFRQNVDGVDGIYTREPISKNEVLMKIPKKCTIPLDRSLFPPNASLAVMHIHSTAKALSNQTVDRDYFTLDALNDLKRFSCFFYNDDSLKLCHKMSKALGRYIQDHNNENKAILEALVKFDSSIDADLYLETILNYRSRAMGRNGFVPAAVYFNHSSTKGLPLENGKNELIVSAKQAYEAGEELYVSYGDVDLLKHATSYNYYDDNDNHFVQLNKRFAHAIKDLSDQKLAQALAGSFAISPKAVGMFKGFAIDEPRAFFSLAGPSQTLLEIAGTFAAHGKAKDSNSFLKNVLLELKTQNKIDAYGETNVPKQLHRYLKALQKESLLIEKNLDLLKG